LISLGVVVMTALSAALVAFVLAGDGGRGNVVVYTGDAGNGIMPSFTSYEQLGQFLGAMDSYYYNNGYYYDQGSNWFGGTGLFGGQQASSGMPSENTFGKHQADDTLGGGGVYYSTTNVQVASVDEEDFVKTDGRYLFISSAEEIAIIEAYPPSNLTQVATIDAAADANSTIANLRSFSIVGLYYVEDDNLLAVCEGYVSEAPAGSSSQAYSAYSDTMSLLLAYDISDRAAPEFKNAFGISGKLQASRLANGIAFLLTIASVEVSG